MISASSHAFLGGWIDIIVLCIKIVYFGLNQTICFDKVNAGLYKNYMIKQNRRDSILQSTFTAFRHPHASIPMYVKISDCPCHVALKHI